MSTIAAAAAIATAKRRHRRIGSSPSNIATTRSGANENESPSAPSASASSANLASAKSGSGRMGPSMTRSRARRSSFIVGPPIPRRNFSRARASSDSAAGRGTESSLRSRTSRSRSARAGGSSAGARASPPRAAPAPMIDQLVTRHIRENGARNASDRPARQAAIAAAKASCVTSSARARSPHREGAKP